MTITRRIDRTLGPPARRRPKNKSPTAHRGSCAGISALGSATTARGREVFCAVHNYGLDAASAELTLEADGKLLDARNIRVKGGGTWGATLVVPEDTPEMITFFNITGCMVYLDEKNAHAGYEDVFTKIDMCRRHYEACGLGADYLDQFIR